MRSLCLLTALAAVLAAAGSAGASAPPVGPLPPGPLTRVETTTGSLVAVALPHRAHGLVWRQATGFGSKVVHEVSEADVGKDVVVVFRADRAGVVTLRFGLTRGETTRARASLSYRIQVRRGS